MNKVEQKHAMLLREIYYQKNLQTASLGLKQISIVQTVRQLLGSQVALTGSSWLKACSLQEGTIPRYSFQTRPEEMLGSEVDPRW